MKTNKLIPAIVLSAFMLIAFYIFQINSLTEAAYALSRTQTKFAQTLSNNQKLQAASAKAFSPKNISELAFQLHFEKIEQVSYVQVMTSSVARK